MEGTEKSVRPNRVDDLKEDDDNLKDTKTQNRKRIRKFWNKFRILTPNSAIIRGSFAMNDKRFPTGSRGRQAVPSSITAIVFGNILSPEDWDTDFMDRVIIYGDKIFRSSCSKNRVHTGVNMTSSMVFPEFFIDDYKCRICATENTVSGNLFSDNSNCPDLMNGVENFFKVAEAGILTTQGFSVAIWRHGNDQYFYFDPAPCADDGSRSCFGLACLLRFKCLNALLEFILSNLNKMDDSKYCIDRINVLSITSIRQNHLDLLKQVEKKEAKDRNLNCSPSRPEKEIITTSKIRRVPVSLQISNSSTDQQMTVENLAVHNSLDTDYTYSDLRVNIPSTFKQLNGLSILHGWTHAGSEIYKGKGAQNVANCLLSIGMQKVNPVKTWLRSTLDEILSLGDALYLQLKVEKPNIKELSAADLNDTAFKIENKKMIAKVDILTIVGTLSSRKTSVLNLKQAVKEFFLVNNSGIIETPVMATAIWTEDEYYYMFDPGQCDSSGLRVVEEKKKGGNTKKDITPEKEKKVNGKSCVIQFSDVSSLANHFIKNIPLGKKNVRFVIRNINVVNDVPGTQAWNFFDPGKHIGTWVLRGLDFANEGVDNKNLSIAINIVGLVFAKKTTPSQWTKETVNEVRREGSEYYKWCLFPDQDPEQFDFSHYKNVLYVNNQKVNLELEEAIIVDNINALGEGIIKFFEKYQYGVVELNGMSFAIWRELDSKDATEAAYYLFLINPKSEKNPEEKKELDCVMRVLNVGDLVKMIKTNVEHSSESGMEFLIHGVNISQIGNTMTNEEIEEDKRTAVKPDLYQYSSINEETACLNGTISQGNALIFSEKTRDQQQSGNALVALAMTKLQNPHLWSKDVLDDILKLGDKITVENIKNLPAQGDEETRNWLLPKEISNEFSVGVNHMRFEIQQNSYSGKLNNLSTVLEEYFAEKSLGIFKAEKTIMPIWKQGSVFFTMDPKGRDSQGIQNEKNGTAAVLWFTSIPALASDLLSTLGGVESSDFSIDSISIENNYETRFTDQEEFQRNNFEKESFINGNIEFTDERFNEVNRGKQSAAIAVMGIIFSKIYSPHKWTSALLDEVIVSGDELHSKCVARLGSNTTPRVNQILNEILLSDRRINLFIKDCVESGGIENNSIKMQDLLSGLDKFFNQYPAGILTVNGDTNFAIWKSQDFYYCILPKSQLKRFENINDFINQLAIDFDVQDFEIIAVEVVNWNKMAPWKFDPSPSVYQFTLPPLNAFKRMQGEARALLRGSTDQASEIFSEKVRNRQAAANCITALGMSVMKSPETWTKSTLDEILSVGNTFYQESLKAHPGSDKLNPNDIVRVFHLGQQVLTADVSDPIVSGKVSIPPPEPETKGKKEKKKAKPDRKKKKGKVKRGSLVPPPVPPLLEEGIKTFFQNVNAGLLVIDRKVLAIWKQLGVYFVYVSYTWNNQDVMDNSSSSSVAWFACIEPFYSYIYNNLDDSEKFSTFNIRGVLFNVSPIKSLPCSVDLNVCELSTASTISNSKIKKISFSGIKAINNYNYEDKELGILHGTRNMNDSMFAENQRGLQSTAIAVVAIVVGSIHVPSTWTPDIIDAILVYGNLLHHDSCRLHKISSRDLSPSELQKVFIVGDFRANIHVHNYTMTGLFFFYDLAETFRFFFRSHNCGILHTNYITVAVTQHFGKFYVFYPKGQNSNEPACIMKFTNVTRMAKAIIANCDSEKSSVYTLNAVNILNLYSFSDSKQMYSLTCEN